MAPRKKTTTVATRNAAKSDARATRGAILRGEAVLNAPVDNPQPRKKRKVESPSPAAPAPAPAAASSAAAGGSSSAAGASSSSAVNTVIIEYCLQGDLFKRKADQIRKGLEKAVPAVNIVVNPVPPRIGCFEIREEGGDTFLSLVDLESPFDELKTVEVKKVVVDIAKRIK